MRVCVLASGSRGNTTFISEGDTKLVIDVGISVKALTARLAEIGESIDQLSGCLISHSHVDHTAGLARVTKHALKRGHVLPAYLTEMTAAKIDWDGLESPPIRFFKPGASFVIGSIQVFPATTPHDDPDPVAFTLQSNHAKVGIAVENCVAMGRLNRHPL